MAISRRGITQDLTLHVLEVVGINDVRVFFQPLIDMKTQGIFAYEALLRSNDPNFRGPPALIDEAIRQNCCGELGRIIREFAVQNCREFPLFLNIHPAEFEDGWLVRPDDPIFVHDHQIFVEITETVPMSHTSYCHGTLDEIRSKGVRLAVDDLGAGYSNLKYIADLEPEIVKLDRQLVADLRVGTRLFKLVSSVVRMCTELGAKVVAEGIETAEEFEACRAAGAHFGQGYFIARPAARPNRPFEANSAPITAAG